MARSYYKIYKKYQTIKDQQSIRTQQLEMTYAAITPTHSDRVPVTNVTNVTSGDNSNRHSIDL